jgi:hypothetical protein
LTVKGAVRNTVIILILALITAVIGISSFETDIFGIVVLSGTISAVLSGYGIYRMYCTLCAVEYAALRALRSLEIDATFEDRTKRKEIESGKEIRLSVGAGSEDDDIENFRLAVYVPEEIEIRQVLTTSAYMTFQGEGWTYANHTLVALNLPFNSRGTFSAVSFKAIAKKKGKFKVPVVVVGKGIYEFDSELILEVV